MVLKNSKNVHIYAQISKSSQKKITSFIGENLCIIMHKLSPIKGGHKISPIMRTKCAYYRRKMCINVVNHFNGVHNHHLLRSLTS